MKSIDLKSTKLYVGLGASVDFSRWDSLSTNARIDELHKPRGLAYFEVTSLNEASDLVRKFIKEFNLGASNWRGGIVLDESMQFVASVSYNGTVWDNEDWRVAKKIELC